MATPALQTRPVTENYTRVPNSFIQNQHLFKLPASRALALIAFRVEQDSKWHGRITDAHWHTWTGLSPRAKELASTELKGFGLEVSGRGDKVAKYSWNWDRWHEAIQTKHQGEYDPKRAEREKRAVIAKEGAKVHEECHDHGCAMLREGSCPGSSDNSTADAVMGSKPKSGLFLTSITQPVAQTVEEATEKAWAASMAALQSFFPILKVIFLIRLLQIVRGYFPTITDQELAEAIHAAFVPQQFSPKLFLSSVPNAIARLRREKKSLELSPPIKPNDGSELPHILPGMEKEQRSFDNIVRILKAAKKGGGS